MRISLHNLSEIIQRYGSIRLHSNFNLVHIIFKRKNIKNKIIAEYMSYYNN